MDATKLYKAMQCQLEFIVEAGKRPYSRASEAAKRQCDKAIAALNSQERETVGLACRMLAHKTTPGGWPK